MDASALIERYEDQLKIYLEKIRENKAMGTLFVISDITNSLVLSLMIDAGRFHALSGRDKKTLVMDSIDILLTKLGERLNEEELFAAVDYDDAVLSIVQFLLPVVIDNLISVENGTVRFNPSRRFLKFFCCRR